MPSAAPRRDSTSSTPRARRPGSAEAVPMTASPMIVVVPATRAPRSRLRLEVRATAAYSSQHSLARTAGDGVTCSPVEELGGVEDRGEQGLDPESSYRVHRGDLLVLVVADSAAAGLDEHGSGVLVEEL